MLPPAHPAREDRRRSFERLAAIACAALLIVFRSYVFAAYERAFFDSDQAITGLMAKHLAEGRAFPLFFYGQAYMLGVEAWLAAPWFWVAPASVATLRASLILTNVAVAILLIVTLERGGRLRPFYALAASAFFIIPPPVTSARLVETQGGSIEPFLYIVLLWMLRDRPVWFGSLLGIGFLNREFTVYAVPVLVAGALWQRRLFLRETLLKWLVAFVAFVATWEGVQALKPFADLLGPGTRGMSNLGTERTQIRNLIDRLRLEPSEWPARVVEMVTGHLPRLLGAARFDAGFAGQGHDWLAWPLVLATAAIGTRLAFLAVRGDRSFWERAVPGAAFGWYLLGVGIAAAAGFLMARPVVTADMRYGLLALFIPIGLTAVALSVEPRRAIRGAIVASIAIWALCAAVDDALLLRKYAAGQPNELRALADALIARHIDVTTSDYWRAYKLTFLAGERVRVASTDYVRILEYQNLAAAKGRALLEIHDDPCPGGEQVAIYWYLCRAGP